MRFLLIGRSLANRRDVAAALSGDGATIDIVADADEAITYCKTYQYAAILVPTHRNTIRTLRAAGLREPLIAFADCDTEGALAEAYRLGADDVVQAESQPALLWARIVAVGRRACGQQSSLIAMGKLTVDLQACSVTSDGNRVHLTSKEFKILETMLLRRGQVLRKEQFLQALYSGPDEPESKIIDVLVCKLRKKLLAAGAPGLVRTVWGQGYMVAA